MTVNLPMASMQTQTIFYGIGAQMFMTHRIKTPLMGTAHTLFDKKASLWEKAKALKRLNAAFQAMKLLPEPTKINTWHPNTKNLLDLRDYLFEHCKLNFVRMGFVRRVMNFIIILYDFDPPWRFIFDSLIQKALKMEWKQRGYEDTWTPTYTWWEE